MKNLFKYFYIFLILFCFKGEATCPEAFTAETAEVEITYNRVNLRDLDTGIMDSTVFETKLYAEELKKVFYVEELEKTAIYKTVIYKVFLTPVQYVNVNVNEKFSEYFLRVANVNKEKYSNIGPRKIVFNEGEVYVLLTEEQFSHLRKNWKKKRFKAFKDLDLPILDLDILSILKDPELVPIGRGVPFM